MFHSESCRLRCRLCRKEVLSRVASEVAERLIIQRESIVCRLEWGFKSGTLSVGRALLQRGVFADRSLCMGKRNNGRRARMNLGIVRYPRDI